MRRIIAFSLIGLLPAAAMGQIDPLASSAEASSPVGISVPDSPAAAELMAKARDKEQQKEWKTAAEFYQSALEKYSRRVAAWQVDAEHEIFEYGGVGLIVQQRLAGWPEEGLNVYRQMYGQMAADALAGSGDIEGVDHVFANYFVTDAGAAAGERLMDLHLEAGRFLAAAWVGQRLLDLHPNLAAERPMVLFRTGMAWHWAGNDAAAGKILDELKQKYMTQVGTVGGKDVVLAEALAAAMGRAAPRATTRPADADTWPSFGGAGGRGEVSASVARPGASITKIPLIQPEMSAVEARAMENLQPEQKDWMAAQELGVMPAVDGGELFFQDGRHIYAVNADTGRPLAGWVQTHDGEHPGVYSMVDSGRERGEQLSVTVTPGCVLAVMGQSDMEAVAIAAANGVARPPAARLVCVDRESGKMLWTALASDLPEQALRDGEYNGTARVLGDSVWVVARGGRDREFEDCYVVCLNLSNGQYKWSTYVGSASRVLAAQSGFDPKNTSQIAVADGRLFVLSNLGTVAALDAIDGRILWLNSYPRSAQMAPPMQMQMQSAMGAPNAVEKPWEANPVVVTGGKVVVLPSDGKNILVYDAGSGAELKRIFTDDYDNANILLGMRGNSLVLTTDKGCYCIDWTAYDHDNPGTAIVWARQDVAADTIAGDENTVFGRGFLTSDSVFIPTRHRLYQLGWFKGGKVLSMYPSRGAWFGGQEPGNVLVTSQNVIVAGSSQMDIYTELALVRQRYAQLMAAAPDEPGPRLQFAGVLFNAGEEEAALGELDDAIRLDGGMTSMRPGAGREMIYATAMDFARHAGEGTSDQAGQTTDRLFDRASAAASTPGEKASYLLARAQYAQTKKDYAGVVTLCQQILSDDDLRSAVVSEGSAAGKEAQAGIDAAIHADGSCYAAVEQQAAAALAAAQESGVAFRLMSVATVFPNSRAAETARAAAADRFAAEGRHEAAIDALQQIYNSETDPAAKGATLESIARNFLAMPGGVGPAIDRLTYACRFEANRKLSQPLKLADGSSLAGISLAEAAAALRKTAAQEEVAKLADFHLSPPSSTKDAETAFAPSGSVIPNVATLVRPMGEFSRMDRVAIWSSGGLSVLAAGASGPMWTAAGVSESPIGAAWVGNQLVVWSNQRMWLLSDGGSVAWNSNLHGMAELAMMPDSNAIVDADTGSGDDQNQPGNVILLQQQMQIQNAQRQAIILRGGGRLIINGGVVQLAMPVNVAAAQGAGGGDEQIVIVRPAGNRVVVGTSTGRVVGIDRADGHVAWQVRLSGSAVSELLANSRYSVARLDDPAGSEIVVLDTLGGSVVGRRKFGPMNTQTQLINAALSEEGMLAWTVMNKLFVKDLYEPWDAAPVEIGGKDNTEAAPFLECGGADQLLIHGGRVLAAYDSGKFVRVYDLVHELAGQTDELDPLASGTDSTAFSMRMVGTNLFVKHSKSFARYNLADAATDHDAPQAYTLDFVPQVRDMFVGVDYLVLVNNPVDGAASGSRYVQLLAYRRAPANSQSTRESGELDYVQTINDPEGFVSWQPVNGGLYYLSGDHNLHLLQSVRPKS